MGFIPFNKPFIAGNELEYIKQSVESGKISGDGMFTKKCHEFFEQKYGFKKALLTTSCTDALEMAAILCNIATGDEVIVPAYTFVSTSNAFVLRGAKIVFADSRADHPGIDEDKIEQLITPKTKAIVPVHYAGVACDMDKIMALAVKYNLYVIEDAAQCIDGYYTGNDGRQRPLGSIGHLAAFSFHETKNIICGEGGMLAINDEQFAKRAEIIREKGTNRSSFFRGEIDKYGWVDIGSSFLPSDIIAAFLYGQLENLDKIQQRRIELWQQYLSLLKPLADAGKVKLPTVPAYSTNNAHMFYLLTNSLDERSNLIAYLRKNDVYSVFHYVSLHKSEYYASHNEVPNLPLCDSYADTLVRLPLFYELKDSDIQHIVSLIASFYN